METKRTSHLQSNLNISKKLERMFDEKTLKKILRPFNQMRGGNYFVLDFYRRKMVLDMPNNLVLCGCSRTTLESDGFDFLKKALKKEDSNWLRQMWEEYKKFLLVLDEDRRKDFTLLYDINVKIGTDKGGVEECVLHYKIVPSQLCKNGNLWLALACVSPSLSRNKNNACILNMETKARYKFTGNEFTESPISEISPDEHNMLQMFMQGMLESDISDRLGIKSGDGESLREIRADEKLEVDSPAGAVQRAHQLGLI